MKAFNRQHLRWLALPLFFVFLALAAAGFILQGRTNTQFNQTSLSVLIPFYLLMGFWLVIGALIVWYHPRNPVGWMIILLMPLVALDQTAVGYVAYNASVSPDSLPAVQAAIIWIKWTAMPFGILIFTLSLLLLPNGRLLSKRWRPVAWVALAAFSLYLLLKALEPTPTIIYPGEVSPLAVSESMWSVLNPLHWLVLVVITLCICAGLYSLISRMRHAGSEERQQVKWLVAPPILFIVAIPIILFGQYEESGNFFLLGGFLHMIAVSGFIVALAIAVFKYRFYDIDIIVNRALVYTSLTLLLSGIFFGSVVIMERLFRLLTGQESPLVVVVSTLLIAALFSPLHRWVQELIDRRFYRRKYDAVQTLAAFSPKARDEVDLETLTAELLGVVDAVIQPAELSI